MNIVKNLEFVGEVKINTIYNVDCLEGMKKLQSDSIDGCITDPPYNYEFIGHTWNHEEISRRIEKVKESSTIVKHVPYGSGLSGGKRDKRWYKKNRDNIIEYREWCYKWGQEVFRVLKAGSFCLVFNSSRTIAHVQIALEDAGFYTKDIIVWEKNAGIPKGLNISKKLESIGENGDEWVGWHSCLRNEWEAILIVQKPLINNHIETIKSTGLGLLHAKNSDGSFQSNIIKNIKRDKKDEMNIHCTIKPSQLIEKLIDLTIPLKPDSIVLDPFMGSGTTAICAINKGINFIGFEIVSEYCEISKNRILDFISKTYIL